MFAKATKSFLRDIGSEGDLISVSSLNDSDKLQLLCLVTKKRRFWCWQKPKYHFLSFTLGDILTEGKPLKPVVLESDFVKYEGKFGDLLEANFQTEIGTMKLNAAGKGFVEIQSSFGSLKKEEVDMQQLMKEVQERMINLNHPVLQQMLGRNHETLCILKEKIVTTQKCVLLEHIQTEGKQGGLVGMRTPIVKVSVSEDGNLIQDAKVVLEIPPPTAIAYAVIELYVKRDGRFEFCLLSEKNGGFERDNTESPHQGLGNCNIFSMYNWDVVDNCFRNLNKDVSSDASLNLLKQDILQHKEIFQTFQKLPEEKRSVVYKLLCEILYHGKVVTFLENMLYDICREYKPDLADLNELKPKQQETIRELSQLVGYTVENESLPQLEELERKKLLAATYFLISALEEFDDSALAVLAACCDLQLIPDSFRLLDTVSDQSSCLSDAWLSSDNEKFQMLQKLFASSGIKLERTEHNIKAVTMSEPGISPLILSIVVFGFHALAGDG